MAQNGDNSLQYFDGTVDCTVPIGGDPDDYQDLKKKIGARMEPPREEVIMLSLTVLIPGR